MSLQISAYNAGEEPVVLFEKFKSEDMELFGKIIRALTEEWDFVQVQNFPFKE